MPARYQRPCYDSSVLRHAVLVSLVFAGCSRSASETTPAPRPERTDVIRRGDAPLTLVGPTLDVGDPMPDAVLADDKLAPIQLGSLKGSVIVLSVVPSIDTRVCEAQTHKVSDAIAQMPPGVEVYTVSRDFVRQCQTPILILPDDEMKRVRAKIARYGTYDKTA